MAPLSGAENRTAQAFTSRTATQMTARRSTRAPGSLLARFRIRSSIARTPTRMASSWRFTAQTRASSPRPTRGKTPSSSTARSRNSRTAARSLACSTSTLRTSAHLRTATGRARPIRGYRRLRMSGTGRVSCNRLKVRAYGSGRFQEVPVGPGIMPTSCKKSCSCHRATNATRPATQIRCSTKNRSGRQPSPL